MLIVNRHPCVVMCLCVCVGNHGRYWQEWRWIYWFKRVHRWVCVFVCVSECETLNVFTLVFFFYGGYVDIDVCTCFQVICTTRKGMRRSQNGFALSGSSSPNLGTKTKMAVWTARRPATGSFRLTTTTPKQRPSTWYMSLIQTRYVSGAYVLLIFYFAISVRDFKNLVGVQGPLQFRRLTSSDLLQKVSFSKNVHFEGDNSTSCNPNHDPW